VHDVIFAMPVPTEAPPGGAPAGQPGNPLGGMWPFFLLILVVFMIMPLFNKRERTRRKRLGELKKHDRVVTSGGIYGTITALDERFATLEIAKDVRIHVKRSSLFDIEKPGEDAADAAKLKEGTKS
jgi:preprotein translocase subunit YajC